MKQPPTARRVNLAMLAVALLGFAAVLGFVVVIATGACAQAEGETRALLGRLAWAAAGTLAVTLVMLSWISARWLKLRLKQNPDKPRTRANLGKGKGQGSGLGQGRGSGKGNGEYINAWDEAGRRMAVPETDTIIETPDQFAQNDLPEEEEIG
ncbi:MAG: hypothetical protein DRI61_14950 [Chloroflexi bacterium]|nr:MAG: hypothetical protein DRI61_14950 [Chloroflexota bacterium]